MKEQSPKLQEVTGFSLNVREPPCLELDVRELPSSFLQLSHLLEEQTTPFSDKVQLQLKLHLPFNTTLGKKWHINIFLKKTQ